MQLPAIFTYSTQACGIFLNFILFWVGVLLFFRSGSLVVGPEFHVLELFFEPRCFGIVRDFCGPEAGLEVLEDEDYIGGGGYTECPQAVRSCSVQARRCEAQSQWLVLSDFQQHQNEV